MADFIGSGGPDTFTGTPGNDNFRLEQGGNDNASGGAGGDGFYFGSQLTILDVVDGGADADTVAIQGNYLALALGAINNVETILAASGSDTQFGDIANNFYDYNITTADANVAAGAILTLIATGLRPGEDIVFNGSAETNGNFRVFAGKGLDNHTGGAGSDGFFFGADANLTGADRVNGGAGADSIALRGNYFGGSAVVFENASFTNIEAVVLLSGHTNEYGGPIVLAGFDYTLTMANGNAVAGQRLDISAFNLRNNETLIFDGSAELDGSYRILSGAADDNLIGSAGADLIVSGAGNDVIDGRGGIDQLDGGAGADTFVFTAALGAGNIDTLPDFLPGTDTILLGGAIGQAFAALATGNVSAAAFRLGAAATDLDDRILYDAATGALRYDADGVGGAAAVQFATLPTGLALTAASINVSGAPNAAPVISSGSAASVAENSAPSTIVYQTAASDSDGDTFVYTLSGTDAAAVTIDQSGAVRLVASANFEVKNLYQFNVIATDSAGFFSTRAVNLTITDVNEGGGTTPTVNETAGNNNSTALAQVIARPTLQIANNPNLYDDDLPSIAVLGQVNPDIDVDFYSITLQAGELLLLDIDDVVLAANGLDAVVRVWSPGGTAILFGDDSPQDPGSGPHPNTPGATLDSFVWYVAPTSGTYYFSVESWGEDFEVLPGTGETTGTYRLNVSVNSDPTEEELFALDVRALMSGSEWPTTALTYSFPSQAIHYPPGTSETNGLEQFSAQQQTATSALLQLVANVSALTFQQVAPGPANLRFAMSNEPSVAYAYYPGPDIGGTAWFNKTDFDNPVIGNYAWMGILHETGHALGLKHGHESPPISFDHDSLEYTVMTYRSYPGSDIQGGYSNGAGSYPQTLMILDIAALQEMYGPNFGYNQGDTVYAWNVNTGQLSINGVGQGAPVANRVFMTIWDGNGTDTYDLSAYATGVEIDLRPGEWSQTSAVQIANLGDGNSARGNIANALLYQGDTRSLIENGIGGAGSDALIANRAANTFTGNGGTDFFRWTATADAGTGALVDRILDFAAGSDKIDLSAIDTVPGTPADDAFTFIGAAAFQSVAGQVRYQVEGANVRVQIDADGNGLADMEIIVNNVASLTGADFLL